MAPGADAAVDLRRTAHRAADRMTAHVEAFALNSAVAEVRILSNAVADRLAALPLIEGERQASPAMAEALAEAISFVVRLASPIMPHLCEELWQSLGHDRLVVEEPWPVADPALLISDTVKLAVQINGKLKATIDVKRDADNASVETAALAEPKIAAIMAGNPPRKVIVVPNRIVNVVV
jgi:leucyl-tRNA synthetase